MNWSESDGLVAFLTGPAFATKSLSEAVPFLDPTTASARA